MALVVHRADSRQPVWVAAASRRGGSAVPLGVTRRVALAVAVAVVEGDPRLALAARPGARPQVHSVGAEAVVAVAEAVVAHVLTAARKDTSAASARGVVAAEAVVEVAVVARASTAARKDTSAASARGAVAAAAVVDLEVEVAEVPASTVVKRAT
mgnify:CR=1 FL=1